MASALIAVGLIIYGYRRFHGHPEKADELRSDIEAAVARLRTAPSVRKLTRIRPWPHDGIQFWRSWAIGAVVARFVHTEEVTGSEPSIAHQIAESRATK